MSVPTHPPFPHQHLASGVIRVERQMANISIQTGGSAFNPYGGCRFPQRESAWRGLKQPLLYPRMRCKNQKQCTAHVAASEASTQRGGAKSRERSVKTCNRTSVHRTWPHTPFAVDPTRITVASDPSIHPSIRPSRAPTGIAANSIQSPEVAQESGDRVMEKPASG